MCKEVQLCSPSASTSGSKKPAVGKTPLERMYQVAELARRGRLIRQLAHDEQSTPIDLAERVSQVARTLGIETVVIGAYALAVYKFVRASSDIDLATCVQLEALQQLRQALECEGLRTELRSPDDQDPLGGLLRVWKFEDEEGNPIDPPLTVAV